MLYASAEFVCTATLFGNSGTNPNAIYLAMARSLFDELAVACLKTDTKPLFAKARITPATPASNVLRVRGHAVAVVMALVI